MYHLDGFDAARNLPLILEVEELRGIQFSPGFGHDSLAEALPVHRQIQQAGRAQWIGVDYHEVEAALRALDPRGLLIFTQAPDVEAAEALLQNTVRWSTRHHTSRI